MSARAQLLVVAPHGPSFALPGCVDPCVPRDACHILLSDAEVCRRVLLGFCAPEIPPRTGELITLERHNDLLQYMYLRLQGCDVLSM